MIRAFVVQWRTLCMMYDDNILEMFNISRETVSLFIIIRIRIRLIGFLYPLCLSDKKNNEIIGEKSTSESSSKRRINFELETEPYLDAFFLR